MANDGLKRARRNARWIERYCRVPEGRLVGQSVKLRKWQKDLLTDIYGSPTRRAIISFGRKNGKTAFAAFLLLLHLCGPEARPNSQLFSAAQSREQAAVLFGLAAKSVRMSPDLNAVMVIRDTAKELLCPDLGTKYRALSADAATAYGLSPVFTVHDELGQVKGPRSALYEALETASGAHDEPLSVVISTQAPTDADLLSVLIDDAKKGEDPKVKLALFTADPDADPFAESTIKQANPAFGDFQNAAETLAMAEDARRMSSRENEYRNLILNQRVDRDNPFVSRGVWTANGGLAADDWSDAIVYAGLDLSAVHDLTAFVPIAQIDGVWHVRPTFWLPLHGLAEKSRSDRVPYDIWAAAGLIETPDAKSIEYEQVATWIFSFCATHNVRKIAFDRWGMKYLRPWLIKAGFSDAQIDEIFVEFGQGYQSMSPALRDLESLLLNEKMRTGWFNRQTGDVEPNPVLAMCAANSVVKMDPAGGRKLVKTTDRRRIDGMIALAMAAGCAPLDVSETPATSPWDDPEFSLMPPGREMQ